MDKPDVRAFDVPALAGVVLGALLIAAIPLMHLFVTTGTIAPPLIPSLQSDNNFYLPQIRTVLNGSVGIGNPFLREYADRWSQSLTLPIWIAAAPAALGLTLSQTYAANIVLYTLLFALLSHALLLRCAPGRPWLAVAGSLLATAYAHDLIIRPAIMQTVYPVFLAFLVVLHAHLAAPSRRWPIAVLGVLAAFSFYHYLYLWMTVFSCLGLVLLWHAWERRWAVLGTWIAAGAGVILLCAPQILAIVRNLGDPLMRESAFRIGLIDTHVVDPHAFTYNKYVLLFAACIVLFRALRTRALSPAERLLLFAGTAVVGVAASNLLTGKTMELPSHAWRFGAVLMVPASAYMLQQWQRPELVRWIAAGCAAVLLLAVGVTVALKPFWYLHAQRSGMYDDLQSYAPILDELNALPARSVILAPASMNTLVSIYTHHFVLHDEYAPFHVAETDELFERFVLQHLPRIDERLVSDRLQDFAGFGPGHAAADENSWSSFCASTGFCEPAAPVTRVDVARQRGMIGDLDAVRGEFLRDIDAALARFGVSFVVIDASAEDNPPRPENGTVIHEDARWTIVDVRR